MGFCSLSASFILHCILLTCCMDIKNTIAGIALYTIGPKNRLGVRVFTAGVWVSTAGGQGLYSWRSGSLRLVVRASTAWGSGCLHLGVRVSKAWSQGLHSCGSGSIQLEVRVSKIVGAESLELVVRASTAGGQGL